MSKLTSENQSEMLSNLLTDESKPGEVPELQKNEDQKDTTTTQSELPPTETPTNLDIEENKGETQPTNIEGNETVPELTQYEVTCKCCCCEPCAIIRTDEKAYRSFWGSHELDSVCMNVFVSGMILFVELVHFLIIFPMLGQTRDSTDDTYYYDRTKFYYYQIPCLVIHLITLIFFLWSYFSAACMDPGFLPYNWNETRKTKYKWDEQLSGLAIRQDQVEYATIHRPFMASFSKSAGRFVIRADHICGWIGNWVGKRNHKQFILMNIWGSLYSLNLFLWHVPILRQIIPNDGRSLFFVYILLIFFEGCLELVFAILLFYVFVMLLDDLRKDLTKIKKWKNERGQDYSCMKATREVFGPGNVCCFVIPTPAFGDVIIFDEQIQEDPANYNLE